MGTSSRDVGSSLAPSCALSALSAFCDALSIAACVGTPAGFAQITKSAWRAPHTARISSGIAATAFGRRWTRRYAAGGTAIAGSAARAPATHTAPWPTSWRARSASSASSFTSVDSRSEDQSAAVSMWRVSGPSDAAPAGGARRSETRQPCRSVERRRWTPRCLCGRSEATSCGATSAIAQLARAIRTIPAEAMMGRSGLLGLFLLVHNAHAAMWWNGSRYGDRDPACRTAPALRGRV